MGIDGGYTPEATNLNDQYTPVGREELSAVQDGYEPSGEETDSRVLDDGVVRPEGWTTCTVPGANGYPTRYWVPATDPETTEEIDA